MVAFVHTLLHRLRSGAFRFDDDDDDDDACGACGAQSADGDRVDDDDDGEVRGEDTLHDPVDGEEVGRIQGDSASEEAYRDQTGGVHHVYRGAYDDDGDDDAFYHDARSYPLVWTS